MAVRYVLGGGGVGAFVPWNNDDGLHPHGPCSGYAVYSSITEAFWQIRHERQKGLPLPGECMVKWTVAMLHGLEKDPLIGEPILERAQEPPEELVPYQGAYPVGHFDIRPEPFGYTLVRGNRITPVGPQAQPILDALDGRSTLRQIEQRFGQEALDFVGALYQKGFVELK